MNEFEQYITDIGLVEFAEWHFKKDECDEYLHEPTNIAHKIWVDKDRAIDELQKINSTNQNTLQHFEHEYKKVVVERDALQKRIDSALQMLGDWDDQTYRDDVEQLIGELGDALRGVNDINLTR